MCSNCPKRNRFEKKEIDPKDCLCLFDYSLMLGHIYDWYSWYDPKVRGGLKKNLESIDHLVSHMKTRFRTDDDNRQAFVFKDLHALIKRALRERKRVNYYPDILFVGKYESVMYQKFNESTMCDYVSNISFIQEKDLDDLDDSSFDVVVLNSYLHHATDPDKLLRNLNRILGVNNVLIVREHDCSSWKVVYELDLLHYILNEVRGDKELVSEYRTRSSWRELISSHGFSIHEKLSKYEASFSLYYDVFTLKDKLPVASLDAKEEGEKDTSRHKP